MRTFFQAADGFDGWQGLAVAAEMAVDMGLGHKEVFGRWRTMCKKLSAGSAKRELDSLRR